MKTIRIVMEFSASDDTDPEELRDWIDEAMDELDYYELEKSVQCVVDKPNVFWEL